MKTVGIIGGGIGGVATAAALHRSGIHATVYERAPVLEEVGAGMMLWPNAARVLKSLGTFDVPALCTRRSDLLEALLSVLPNGQVCLGCEFTHLEQLGSKVRLHFADGHVAEHDAVVGADGIRSRVRAQLFGITDPVYRGYVVWRGVAAYRGQDVRPGYNSETWGAGSRVGILDIGHGRFTWYATANIPRRDGSPGECKSDLLQRCAGWHQPIPALIESTELILENGAYDLPPLPHWTVGRVTLLGDAAHPCTPNLGQGGCMALEDAMVLAKCLAKCISREASVESALRRYESLRKSRTRHIQHRSLVMGHIGQWQNRAAVTGRRVATSLLPAALFEHNLRRVYSYET
jgi:2-polyprenyl-6-methoxyphenol hydroxylase-like FAD-dependent oxidoreductase